MFVRALNHLYVQYPALWRHSFTPEGYEWISGDDTGNSVLSYLRKGDEGDKCLLVVCHFQTSLLENYSVGVPSGGVWKEVLNSDDKTFGGSGVLNGEIKARKEPSHGQEYSVSFNIPALSVMVFEGALASKKEKAISSPDAKPQPKPVKKQRSKQDK